MSTLLDDPKVFSCLSLQRRLNLLFDQVYPDIEPDEKSYWLNSSFTPFLLDAVNSAQSFEDLKGVVDAAFKQESIQSERNTALHRAELAEIKRQIAVKEEINENLEKELSARQAVENIKEGFHLSLFGFGLGLFS